jgi:tetratricopeptide (TPR) repeat protein
LKREYLILALFLGIIIVSGAVIYLFQGSKSQPVIPAGAGEGAGPTEGLQMPPGPDTVAIRGEIVELEGQIRKDPGDYGALVGLGNKYYDLNEPEKAIEYYEKALVIKRDDPAVLVDCGAMYRLKGDPDKALELFREAIKIDPNLPQAYFNLGMVLAMEKKDKVGAAKAWKKYLELDPNSQAREFLKAQIDKALGGK